MNRRRLMLLAGGLFIVCIVIGVIGEFSNIDTSTEEVAQATTAPTLAPAHTEEETKTEQEEATPLPTDTPEPTATPRPTDTPEPTATPTPPPEPIILSGSGDTIVDVDKWDGPAIAHISGNAGSRHFAVTNYDSQGNQMDLLVNTTDPYDGIRPLDFLEGDQTTRFEINATGDWSIELYPLAKEYIAEGDIHSMEIPGTYEGNGADVVFLLSDNDPDTAIVSGNAEERHFAVTAYGGGFPDLLINTTDVYEGTVIVSRDTVVLEVQATGPWTIEMTAR